MKKGYKVSPAIAWQSYDFIDLYFQLSFEPIEQIFHQLRELGTFELVLTGESFFVDKMARAMGFDVIVFTNAGLMDKLAQERRLEEGKTEYIMKMKRNKGMADNSDIPLFLKNVSFKLTEVSIQ